MRLFDKITNKFCWIYRTQLPIEDCIAAIMSTPKSFGINPLNLHRYDCIQQQNNHLLIIFRGMQYGRFVRTEYLFTFSEEQGSTTIETKFLRDFLGIFPCISTYDLDVLMEEKIRAYRNN